MLAGFLAANGVIIAVAAALLWFRPASPPQIQGVLLGQGRELADFELIDHRNRPFSNADLEGQWHLLSYGFTTCPDICPTTLHELTEFADALESREQAMPQILFYSVDYRRDTPQQLASYLHYFDPDFLGLTHRDNPDNPHLPFERSLGIVFELIPEGGSPEANYQVSHGLTLFLINPAGELQAVFQPDTPRGGAPHFDPDRLLNDYLAVREYLAAG